MKTIALARGVPPLSVMKQLKPAMMQALNNLSETDEKDFLQYGHFAGYEPLRETMAQRFGVSKNRVFIGNGSMDTLHLFLLFLQTRNKIGAYLCGKEVYDRPVVIAKALGLNPKPLIVNEDGVDLDRLKSSITAANTPGVLYTIPWFDNPSGVSHSSENMTKAAQIAAENDWFVIRDGAYIELAYQNAVPIEPVLDNVIQTFSWSKMITAANHTGGIIIPEQYSADFLHFISSWRLSPVLPTQMVTWQLIESGELQNHLENVIIPDGKRRTEHFNALMDQYLPESKRRDITGGHFWGGKIHGLTEQNWDRFSQVAEEEYGLKIPHYAGFMPLCEHSESAGYIRIPLFTEDAEIQDPLRQIVTGIAAARDAVVSL
jgi:DNA-binding transcriptional MocR family regulator